MKVALQDKDAENVTWNFIYCLMEETRHTCGGNGQENAALTWLFSTVLS